MAASRTGFTVDGTREPGDLYKRLVKEEAEWREAVVDWCCQETYAMQELARIFGDGWNGDPFEQREVRVDGETEFHKEFVMSSALKQACFRCKGDDLSIPFRAAAVVGWTVVLSWIHDCCSDFKEMC